MKTEDMVVRHWLSPRAGIIAGSVLALFCPIAGKVRGNLESKLSCNERNQAVAEPSGMPPVQYLIQRVKAKGSDAAAFVVRVQTGKPAGASILESAVGFAERFILAALRNRTFFSLAELNHAIREKLVELNSRKLQKIDTSRRELCEKLDTHPH